MSVYLEKAWAALMAAEENLRKARKTTGTWESQNRVTTAAHLRDLAQTKFNSALRADIENADKP